MNYEIGRDFLFTKDFAKEIFPLASEFVIVTDSIVENLLAKKLQAYLLDFGLSVHLISFEAGEKNKTRRTKEEIEDKMLQLKLLKDTCLIAMGGGVVTDLAGFVAATYMRSIPYISIPTTLLGMVDASLGGKTGVNTPLGKNLVGAFYPPLKTYIDLSCLNTLPEKLFAEGMSEVIKYALIGSKSLFNLLMKKHDLLEIVTLSCQEKMRVVKEDPYEKGLRHTLNFGHTIGHALENILNYEISHGEAVAFGMLKESELNYKLGSITEEELTQIRALIKKYHATFSFSETIPWKTWEKAMSLDKKSTKKNPRFVLLNGIGQTNPCQGFYCEEIPALLLQTLLKTK